MSEEFPAALQDWDVSFFAELAGPGEPDDPAGDPAGASFGGGIWRKPFPRPGRRHPGDGPTNGLPP